jgi:hypothetical protein
MINRSGRLDTLVLIPAKKSAVAKRTTPKT